MSRAPRGAAASPGAILLAAGASRRMGRPKALLRLHGRSLLELCIDALVAASASPIVVVTGATPIEPWEVAEPGSALVWVHNARWAEGPTISLQVGLRAALEREPAMPGFILHTVDRPRVSAATLCALVRAWREAPASPWQPCRDGRRGHPVLWPHDAFDALLGLAPEQSRGELLRGPLAPSRRQVEVDDPGVHDNIDDPEKFAALV